MSRRALLLTLVISWYCLSYRNFKSIIGQNQFKSVRHQMRKL